MRLQISLQLLLVAISLTSCKEKPAVTKIPDPNKDTGNLCDIVNKAADPTAFTCLKTPNLTETGLYSRGNDVYSNLETIFGKKVPDILKLYDDKPTTDFSFNHQDTISVNGSIKLSRIASWLTNAEISGGYKEQIVYKYSISDAYVRRFTNFPEALKKIIKNPDNEEQRSQINDLVKDSCSPDSNIVISMQSYVAKPELTISTTNADFSAKIQATIEKISPLFTAERIDTTTFKVTSKGVLVLAVKNVKMFDIMNSVGICKNYVKNRLKEIVSTFSQSMLDSYQCIFVATGINTLNTICPSASSSPIVTPPSDAKQMEAINGAVTTSRADLGASSNSQIRALVTTTVSPAKSPSLPIRTTSLRDAGVSSSNESQLPDASQTASDQKIQLSQVNMDASERLCEKVDPYDLIGRGCPTLILKFALMPTSDISVLCNNISDMMNAAGTTDKINVKCDKENSVWFKNKISTELRNIQRGNAPQNHLSLLREIVWDGKEISTQKRVAQRFQELVRVYADIDKAERSWQTLFNRYGNTTSWPIDEKNWNDFRFTIVDRWLSYFSDKQGIKYQPSCKNHNISLSNESSIRFSFSDGTCQNEACYCFPDLDKKQSDTGLGQDTITTKKASVLFAESLLDSGE